MKAATFLNRLMIKVCNTLSVVLRLTPAIIAIKARGKAVRSNAYQFVVRNGNIITMQTEWSLFVNPWTKLVDFVIGCHSIIEGCPKSDMFVRSEERVILSTEKAQLVQAKIKMLLSQVCEIDANLLQTVDCFSFVCYSHLFRSISPNQYLIKKVPKYVKAIRRSRTNPMLKIAAYRR